MCEIFRRYQPFLIIGKFSSRRILLSRRQFKDVEANMGVGGDCVRERLPPIDFDLDRFPYSIVWTPIPVLTWILPFIGHMGICMANGVIRDFAGPYLVTEDNMAFGRPTRYLRLHPKNVDGGSCAWDEALNNMHYKDSSSWNMIILCFWMFVCGRYVGVCGFIKTWLPFLVLITVIVLLAVYF
ncbi:hypothetical protein ACLKA7_003799 [Drosophila subpalustris]